MKVFAAVLAAILLISPSLGIAVEATDSRSTNLTEAEKAVFPKDGNADSIKKFWATRRYFKLVAINPKNLPLITQDIQSIYAISMYEKYLLLTNLIKQGGLKHSQ